MAFTTSMIPEQAQVKDRADELLSLCKKAVVCFIIHKHGFYRLTAIT